MKEVPMASQESRADFHRDPLQFLDQAFPAAGDAVWLPGRRLCLSEAEASRAVLVNDEDLYEDHSDFFHTRRGNFGPRSAQVEMGRSARTLLRAHLRERADKLPAAVQALAPVSEWPDAGNWLAYRHFADALIAPDSPARLRAGVEQIVHRAVLAGARERYSRLTRAVFRFRVMRELGRAVRERRKRAGEPVDVLDVVARAAPEAPERELAEVFLSFLFAAAGSVGFVLGWSLYLMGTHPDSEAEPSRVVREALRLWPVAWLLARRPIRPHEVAGTAVTPENEVIVCPYAVHRNPRHWEDPHAYRPERWAADHDPRAFIPFGWGPHRCIAGTLSMQMVEDVLQILDDNFRLTVTPHGNHPHVSAALAPPRFSLTLEPR
ncbi:MAG TPA: cytochrome P450 [Thermoanaerobaculia bacterium]|nr:cytochrome P450 [Thermoanaerobaculia bacterium]